MKTRLLGSMILILCITMLTGCPWFKPGPDDVEGEGEPIVEGEAPVEGETPVEGEDVLEGEQPDEGEVVSEGEPVEGEYSEVMYTSADVNGYYRDDSDGMYDTPTENEEDPGSEERELVEPDVIRRDGDLLFILNQYRGLIIADLASETLLSQTPTYGYPRDLYLVGDRAYVLVSYACDITETEGELAISYGSKVYVMNISNPAKVVMEGSFNLEGDLIDSRMVGNIIYAVCSDYTYYGVPENGDGAVVVEPERKSYGATWAVSVNISDTSNIAVADKVSFPGYGSLIQATNYAIFCVSTDWSNVSTITYVDITDAAGKILIRGTADVPGYMADRFKMDAWNGVLRVVTNTWWPDQQTVVTTLDIANPDSIMPLGQTSLANASGETLFATRFDGPLAYIVTYLRVDPLFVVDLSDPAKPEVKGELKIPGWSTHIEPMGDRLIALGVDDSAGRKVMVSLFDVSDPSAPSRITYQSFGEDWAWSEAYNDVKAFTVLDDMLLIPFSGWNYGSGGYDRLQFVSYTHDSLQARGYVDLQGSAKRSFRNEGIYYAVTQEQLAVIDAANPDAPAVVNELTLAENITDVAPLADDWLVEIISRYDTGDTLLRASHPALDVVGGTIEIPVAYVSNSFVWNNSVVIVSSMYEYEPVYRGYYQVYLVDFTDPSAPTLSAKWDIAMQPWWGGWWYYDMPMAETMNKDAMYYGGWYGGDSAYLAGDYLVLRGTAGNYDVTLGDYEVWQGLALVDLAGVDKTTLVGLGYENLLDVDVAEGQILISTKKQVGTDRMNRPICANYLFFLNPATLEVSRAVNVPGVFAYQQPGTKRLLFNDTQYGPDWQTVTILRSTEMVGSTVRLLDSATLPVGYWSVLADGDDVYYTGYSYGYYVERENAVDVMPVYSNSYLVGSFDLTAAGEFTNSREIAVGQFWINLLGVQGDMAYLSLNSAGIAQYDFGTAPPSLKGMIPVMGYPQKLRFGSTHAYAPLGYSGTAVFEK